MAALQLPAAGAANAPSGDVAPAALAPATLDYTKFTSQDQLGHYLQDHYKIRNSRDLMSCEVCHR
jgi:hypothetical protein